MVLSGLSTVVMIVVIVAALAAFIAAVFIGARRPWSRHPKPPSTPVSGGIHQGNPRSVAPHRDEPVEPGESTEPAGPRRTR